MSKKTPAAFSATPDGEALVAQGNAATTAIDWARLLQEFGPVILQILLRLLSKTPQPVGAAPGAAAKASHGHCDHQECCLETVLYATLTLESAVAHCEACHAEANTTDEVK